jgi:hypothetical protein
MTLYFFRIRVVEQSNLKKCIPNFLGFKKRNKSRVLTEIANIATSLNPFIGVTEDPICSMIFLIMCMKTSMLDARWSLKIYTCWIFIIWVYLESFAILLDYSLVS